MLTSIVYSYAVLFLMTRIVHVQLDCSCKEPDTNFTTGVNLLYYKCNNENTTIAYPITAPEDMLKSKVLKKDKRTIFYVFGYMQTPERPNVQVITEALCYKETDNVVLLDWSKHSEGLYPDVCVNAEKVGRSFAQSIRKLVDYGLDISKIYIVAHSLGALIAGFAGKCNNFTIPRITALDPANPFLYLPGCNLTRNDASWIDVIHTDAGVYGTPTKMGTAEFYVNGGSRPQPGCPIIGIPPNPIGINATDVCSHQRSVQVYKISKYSPEAFTAYKCSSYINFVLSKCKENEKTGIGNAAQNMTGTFYFDTGAI